MLCSPGDVRGDVPPDQGSLASGGELVQQHLVTPTVLLDDVIQVLLMQLAVDQPEKHQDLLERARSHPNPPVHGRCPLAGGSFSSPSPGI